MKNPSLRCWAEIDGLALKKNLHFLRSCIEHKTKVIAVVKANGFGHGMVPIARELLKNGAEVLGVAHIHEASELRRAGIKCPILLLSAALPSEFSEIIRLRAWPMLSTLEEARLLDRAAKKLKVTAEAHFKIDTGMGRMGLRRDAACDALQSILLLKHLHILAVATHLARADDDPISTRRQLEEFAKFRSDFPELPFHVANSAASCQRLVSQGNFVRVGLAIYGLPPLPRFWKKLVPILSWKSRISLIRKLPAGQTISYGATYRLLKSQTIATVAVGYGDGYPLALSNRGGVLIRGVRCPIRGRVTMDQVLVDISNAHGARVEDEVVLIGHQGNQSITADQMAAWANTISYDIVTSISARVARVYRNWETKPR